MSTQSVITITVLEECSYADGRGYVASAADSTAPDLVGNGTGCTAPIAVRRALRSLKRKIKHLQRLH